ncbi:MAG: hypothetical protein SO016_06830 [Lachnospiraceae bacterium]|nr:hypothetical protein [Robinsoniella sp.]MDY3766394.1 hypothetical protein [Lachnospiraceae bacterium]
MRKKIFGMVAIMALAGTLAVGCGSTEETEKETSTATEKVESGSDESEETEEETKAEETATEEETKAD